MVTYRNADASAGLDASAGTGADEQIDIGTSLVIDLDEHLVRGVLFDSVEGYARFVASAQAPSTLGQPIADAAVGVREVVSILEAQTGLELGAVADGAFALTGYPVRPLSVAIVPTGQETLTTALAATCRATSSIVYLLNDVVRTEDGVLSSTRLEAQLRGIQPDIVVLLEGDRAQSEWASAVGTVGTLLVDQPLDQLIVLASEEFQQYMLQALGDSASLTGLDPNHHEAHEVAMALETELSELYEQRVGDAPRLELGRELKFVSRLRASDLATRYISRRLERSVAAVDVSSGAVINCSTLHAGGSIARPELDVHANVRGLLASGFEALRSFIPFDVAQEDLANWILNRAVRSRAVSDLWRDQIIESVMLSHIVSTAWKDLAAIATDQMDILVAGPGFCFDADPALGVLAVVNGFQPTPLGGIVQVVLDPDGLLSAAGAIGDLAPVIAADVIEHDLVSPAATVVVVEGAGEETQPAVSGNIAYEGGETVEFMVPYGSLHRLPLGENERATLSLICEPGFSIGGSDPGEQVQIGLENGLKGGEVGIVIDARGRPMAGVQDDVAQDREAVRRWYSDLGIEL